MKRAAFVTLCAVVLMVVVVALNGALAVKPKPKWASTGGMMVARSGACSVLLADDRILVTGGSNEAGVLSSAEFLGLAGESSTAAPMNYARAAHLCVALPDGTVLVAGGSPGGEAATNSAEVYDPASNTWRIVGAMGDARAGVTASLLDDGRVLIAGGEASGAVLASLEIYDPVTGTFSVLLRAFSTPRKDHAAAVLSDGRVLFAGGSNGEAALDTVEIYNPATGEISLAGKLTVPRAGLSATTLLDGRVFFAGGNNGETDLASTEIYDPSTGAITPAKTMDTPRSGHLAFRLPNNNSVLIAGGTFGGVPLASAGIYVPWRNSYEPTELMAAERASATGVALKGSVVVAGGSTRRATTESVQSTLFPTIQTDKLDYSPGETVLITGANWTPGNKVDLLITILPERSEVRWQSTVTVAADGAVSASLVMEDRDLNKTFELTASEQGTLLTAQAWVFTDGSVVVYAAPSAATFTLIWTEYKNSANCTGDIQGSGTYTIDSSGKNYGVGGNNSILLMAAATSNQGGEFVNWTTPSGTSTANPICVPAPSGSANYTANYAEPPSDTTPPVITPTVSGTLGNNGWYVSDVSVSWSVTDPESAITSTSGCDTTSITADAAGTILTCTATSAGGTSSQSVTIKRDATAPSASASASPGPNANGWNNTDVTVSFSGTDGLSGIDACDAPVTLSSEGAGQSASGTCTDKAGNVSALATASGINIDKTPPTASASPSPGPNANGWNNTDVTVSFSGSDALSGIDFCSADVVLSSEGAGQSASGTCTDEAGNVSAAASLTVNIDKTAPTASASASPGPNANGWNNTDVTVSFTGSDALSGIDFCSADVVLNTDGTSQSASGTCTDKAGNVSAPATASGINIDKTPPLITFVSLTPAPNGAGWNNTDVTVNWSCEDSLSGPLSATASQVLNTEGANQSATGTCMDNAGNSASNTKTGINIDITAPTASAGASPGPNANGWNNTDVTVSFTGSDALSGIDFCSADVVLNTDGTSQSASGTCTDKAGNVSAPATASGINIDKTPPLITFVSLTPAPNGAGWNNADVTVNWSCEDSLSGPLSTTASQVLNTEGANQSATGTCTDYAGNSASDTQTGINIDKTPPVITATVTGPLGSGGWYIGNVSVSWTVAENVSGIVSAVGCEPTTLDTDTAETTLTCTAINGAGWIGSASVTIKIDKTPPEVSFALDPVPVTQAVTLSATVTDTPSGVASVSYAIAGGSTGIMTGGSNSTYSASLAPFANTGVFNVCVTATDDASNVTTQCALLAVYDPSGGFVTGGGWITSPVVQGLTYMGVSGKAHFGFVSKYQKGANVPTGNTEFQFQAGNLNFKSTSYEWLVIAGARAQYKGSGTVNGSGDYGFMLTAIDGQVNGGGGVDKFRIKIWHKVTETVVYDNQFGALDTAEPTTVIGGGSIVIHNK